MSTRRIARLNEQTRADIAQLVSREMRDPRIAGMVSITSVDLSPDLSHARVYVSVMGTDDQRRQTLRGLRAAAGFLRSQLAARMTTKRAPELQFALDESIERGDRVMSLIREVERETALRQAQFAAEEADGPE
ncbi:MAG TPA: 30S ribosome-binding factor RbfA [Chloroflexota bacterium]|nr:30S ribosome-binding factor RbfA [Chloroflexota bacterium]